MNPYREAITVLRTHGWTQGEPQDEEGSVCLLGALALAEFGQVFLPWRRGDAGYIRWWNLTHPLQQLLHQETGEPWDVAKWNDRPSTSQEDVELLLKKAAQAWEERT